MFTADRRVGVTSLTMKKRFIKFCRPTKDITVLTPTKESFTEERFESLHLAAIEEYLGNANRRLETRIPDYPHGHKRGDLLQFACSLL